MTEYEPSWRDGVQRFTSRMCNCILGSSLQIITRHSKQSLNFWEVPLQYGSETCGKSVMGDLLVLDVARHNC